MLPKRSVYIGTPSVFTVTHNYNQKGEPNDNDKSIHKHKCKFWKKKITYNIFSILKNFYNQVQKCTLNKIITFLINSSKYVNIL